MAGSFNYTRYARNFVSRFPVISYVLTQVVSWVTGFVFLAILSQLVLLTAGTALQAQTSLRATLIVALFLGFFTGLVSGYMGWLFEKKFSNQSLIIIIVGKAFISLIVFIILISVVRSVVYPYLLQKFFNDPNPGTYQQSWDAFFYLVLIYTIVLGLLISFINLVNKKYGPGVLLPLLFGKYRKPKEEDRFFLFMDLKSSTTIAEALGHLKYSAFIRDSFMDINSVVSQYHGQVYQYAGDEIVMTWTMEEGLKNFACIGFFFACGEKFHDRREHYLKEYGQLPGFKAGLHGGKVTAVEVGDIKRDIAYHGDTINTAARIQSVCNHYNRNFLTSMYVLSKGKTGNYFRIESLGLVELKGKVQPVEIASISKIVAGDN